MGGGGGRRWFSARGWHGPAPKRLADGTIASRLALHSPTSRNLIDTFLGMVRSFLLLLPGGWFSWWLIPIVNHLNNSRL